MHCFNQYTPKNLASLFSPNLKNPCTNDTLALKSESKVTAKTSSKRRSAKIVDVLCLNKDECKQSNLNSTSRKDEVKQSGLTPASNKDNSFYPPSLQEVVQFVKENNFTFSPERFFYYYESRGWKNGRTKIVSWESCAKMWQAEEEVRSVASACKFNARGKNNTEEENGARLRGFSDKQSKKCELGEVKSKNFLSLDGAEGLVNF